MMLRAGVDLVDISRVARMIAISPTAYVRRVWTETEQRACVGRPDRFAARWAAKEAVMKALGAGLDAINPLDVEVASPPEAAPLLRLHGTAAEAASALRLDSWSISLTHERGLAAAFVVGYGSNE